VPNCHPTLSAHIPGVHFARRHAVRKRQERGEVLDWKFLAENYKGKGYVQSKEVINPDGEK
jgi:hypothetical protein